MRTILFRPCVLRIEKEQNYISIVSNYIKQKTHTLCCMHRQHHQKIICLTFSHLLKSATCGLIFFVILVYIWAAIELNRYVLFFFNKHSKTSINSVDNPRDFLALVWRRKINENKRNVTVKYFILFAILTRPKLF